MNDLIVWRDKLQELYAIKSIYIDKAVQFVLALVTFLMINQNIGLMKAVATPVVAVALAVICTFLPPVVTAYVAAGLVIVHLFKLSIGVAAAAALIFVVMFIFYCRFTPKKALLLLVPVSHLGEVGHFDVATAHGVRLFGAGDHHIAVASGYAPGIDAALVG